LELNDNFLTGPIPNEIADLENLEYLALGNNDLTGELPRDVCRVRNLEVISVDCEAQGCQCCTECLDGIDTEAPTEGETIAVTTAAPSACVDLVNSMFSCYERGEDVLVTLSNCDPENDDWVGIYESSENMDGLSNPPVWSWACGSRNCREAVTSQELALTEVEASTGAWPLSQGSYVLVLARNSAQPYTAFAVSSAFTIQDTC
jgi:hypothetical protein